MYTLGLNESCRIKELVEMITKVILYILQSSLMATITILFSQVIRKRNHSISSLLYTYYVQVWVNIKCSK